MRLKFKYYLGYWPDLSNPKTYNEKIQYRKIKPESKDFATLSDKYSVREYVEDKVGNKYLIDVLLSGATPMVSDFKVIDLPYVIKANHNSGPVQIIRNEIELEGSTKEIVKQLGIDYGKVSSEPWYSDIQRQFLVERLLLDDNGDVPVDYKFHCFGPKDNKTIFVQIDYGRFNGHSRSIYDEQLNLLPVGIAFRNDNIVATIPDNFSEMINVAKQLSCDFNYCRVDLFNLKGKVYFGEITFAHGSGFEKFSDSKYDNLWGDLWLL